MTRKEWKVWYRSYRIMRRSMLDMLEDVLMWGEGYVKVVARENRWTAEACSDPEPS